jgi:hypothetical protein
VRVSLKSIFLITMEDNDDDDDDDDEKDSPVTDL